MIKTIERTIRSIAILSENNKYRYCLTKVWEENKQRATVIMLNPSKANELKYDKTVMNISNYLIDNDYGSMDIVNLFSYMTTYPNELGRREQKHEKYNDNYIIMAAERSNIIIIAWGSDSKKYITRKKEVENLLMPYKYKLKCFKDEEGKKPRHPRDLGKNWTLDEYDFMFAGKC